nr:thiolase family protein [Acuticoccus kalidii]
MKPHRSEAPTLRLVAEVIAGVLDTAGLRHGQLDGLSVTSGTTGAETALGIADHLGLSCRYLDGPVLDGASAIAAARRAARLVAAGDVDMVAVIGADRGPVAAPPVSPQTFDPVAADRETIVLALITQAMMRRGATREDFARLCLAQRTNAHRLPFALHNDGPMALEDYLDASVLAAPLVVHDRPTPISGGEGFLVLREVDAVAARLPFARILAATERHNAYRFDDLQFRGGLARDAETFWLEAGIEPDAIDIVETNDECPAFSIMQFEDAGLCLKGEGPAFVRAHTLTRDGSLAHNTSGGLLAAGRPGAAGGHLALVEAIRQVTGSAFADTAEGRVSWQVAGARVGLVSALGGVAYDRGLASAAMVIAGDGAGDVDGAGAQGEPA